MKNTFSKFVLASAIAAAVAFTTIPAMAETPGSVSVNVPFSFTVHGKTLPAGTYQVRWDGTGNFVTMQNGTAVETFLWSPDKSAKADQRVIMLFEKQGKDNTLESIQCGAKTTLPLSQKIAKSEGNAIANQAVGQ
jgi:hypothetical protein